MKRGSDSLDDNPRPTKRAKVAKHHLSDGPLGIVISFLPQNDYANWLYTHRTAKRFKFGGPFVHIRRRESPASYEDWWFHKRSVKLDYGCDIYKYGGWNRLEFEAVCFEKQLPNCLELRITGDRDLISNFVDLHEVTKRLYIHSVPWSFITWTSCSNLEFLQIDGVNVTAWVQIREYFPGRNKLKHLVLRFASYCTFRADALKPPLDGLELFEVYVPAGSLVSTVDPRMRINFVAS